MKTVLVTGGSGGIGSATVRAFAKAGYAVAFTYHNGEAAAKALCKEIDQPNLLAVRADLSESGGAVEVRNRFFETFSHLDVLINCAGVSGESLFQDVTDEEYDRLMDANLRSAFLVTRAFLPDMIARKSGAIVNLSSVWGVSGASMETVYSAAKAGLIGMTKALAKEVGLSGIRVNALAPGMIDTKMNAAYTQEEKAAFLEGVALGRIGLPEEVAQAALFLAEATYITGQTLAVDGGLCI